MNVSVKVEISENKENKLQNFENRNMSFCINTENSSEGMAEFI